MQEDIEENIENMLPIVDDKMKKSIDVLINNLKGIRAGRASADLLNAISVEAYGTKTLLKSQANISVLDDGRTLKIDPWDVSLVGEIKKAIANSNLGLTPVVEGKGIKIVVPSLTSERRQELVKVTKNYGTLAKDAINNIRSHYMTFLKKPNKAKHFAEDEKNILIKKIQDVTSKYLKSISDAVDAKAKDIMQL